MTKKKIRKQFNLKVERDLKIRPKLRPTNVDVNYPTKNQLWQATKNLDQQGVPSNLADMSSSEDVLGKLHPWSITKTALGGSPAGAPGGSPAGDDATGDDAPVVDTTAPASVQIGQIQNMLKTWGEQIDKVNYHYRTMVMNNIELKKYVRALKSLEDIYRLIDGSLKPLATAIDSNEFLKTKDKDVFDTSDNEDLRRQDQYENFFQWLAEINPMAMIQNFDQQFLSGGSARIIPASHGEEAVRTLQVIQGRANIPYIKAEENFLSILKQLSSLNNVNKMTGLCNAIKTPIQQMQLNLQGLASKNPVKAPTRAPAQSPAARTPTRRR